MATLASEFQEIADELINDEFVDMAKSASMETLDTPGSPGNDPVYSTPETGVMIPVEIERSQFELLDIQIGDKLLVAVAQDWTIDPRTDGVRLTFDGVVHDIVNVIPDAADAAYFIQARVT